MKLKTSPNTQVKMFFSMGKTAKVSTGFAVTALFVWLVLREINISEVVQSIAATDLHLIVLAVGLFLLGYVCRVQRWRIMLLHENPELRWRTAAVPFFGSIAVNNLLPLRAGDALRAFGFNDWLKASIPTVVATVLAERLLDLLTLLVALSLVLGLLPISNALEALMGVGIAGISIAAGLLATILLFPKILQPVVVVPLRALTQWRPELGENIVAAVEGAFDTLGRLAGQALMPKLLGLSFLAWGFEAAVFVCVASALTQALDPVAGFVAMPVGTLSTLIPSSPGYIGTFHFFVAKTVELLGNPYNIGVAYAVAVHFILWLTATVVGGACLLIWIVKSGRGGTELEEGSTS